MISGGVWWCLVVTSWAAAHLTLTAVTAEDAERERAHTSDILSQSYSHYNTHTSQQACFTSPTGVLAADIIPYVFIAVRREEVSDKLYCVNTEKLGCICTSEHPQEPI